MFKEIEIWILYLVLLLGIPVTISFGLLVRQELKGNIKLGSVSKTALFLAEIPVNIKKILIANQSSDLKVKDRFPLLRSFKGTPNSQESYLLLSRYDWDLKEGRVELNDLINFESQSEGKISANYKGIGKSPELEGELSALNEPGDVSGLIKRPTSFAFAKLINIAAIDEEDYEEKYPNIKSQLLLSKRFSGGYNEWLRSRKENIEVEDWRHLIY